MRVVKILFLCHITALMFGIAGLLVMLPHPELWSWNPYLMAVFLGIVAASLVFFLHPGRKAKKTAGARKALFKRISVLVLYKVIWVIARRNFMMGAF